MFSGGILSDAGGNAKVFRASKDKFEGTKPLNRLDRRTSYFLGGLLPSR